MALVVVNLTIGIRGENVKTILISAGSFRRGGQVTMVLLRIPAWPPSLVAMLSVMLTEMTAKSRPKNA